MMAHIQQLTDPPPDPVAVERSRRRSETWARVKKNKWAYLFIAPFYVMFTIFGLFPLLFSLVLSFHEWDGIRPLRFVGLENFQFLLGEGGTLFWESMRNSLSIIVFYVPIMTVLALIIAALLNDPRVRGFRIYRALIFAPFVTSMIVAGYVFQMLLGQEGLFNTLLSALGLGTVPWLDTPFHARLSLVLLIIWGGLGYNVVIMLSGLQQIPADLQEAAFIDGATGLQAFLQVTIPLMRPVILFSMIFSVVGAFALFNEVVALGRGPLRSNVTPLVTIYDTAFSSGEFGRAAAQSYVYFLAIFVLTILQFRLVGRDNT
jgi:ABC-type sugar transport system permease subunit